MSEIKYLRTCAPSEDSDQPAHSHKLFRIFTWHFLDSQRYQVSTCGQRKSDQTARTDLSLRWAHMSEGTFFHVVTHLTKTLDFALNLGPPNDRQ